MLFSKRKFASLLFLIFSSFASELKIVDEEHQKLQNVFSNESSVKLWKDVQGNELTWEDSDDLIPKELKERIEFCVKEFSGEKRSSCLFDCIYDWIHSIKYLPSSKIWPFLRGIFRSIAENVDVDKRGNFEETPLMLATLIDAKEAVSKLIERKSIVVEAIDKLGNSVLHFAVKSGSKSACEVLLRNNARVDALDGSCDRNTPLMIAAQKGDVEMVKLLLEFGANKNIKNIRQKTALHIAREFNHQRCVHLLETHLR